MRTPSPSLRAARRRSAAALVVATVLAALHPAQAEAGWWQGSGLRPLFVGIGLAGGGTPGEPDGAHVAGAVTVGLRLIPLVPEVVLREGVSGGSELARHHGNVAFGARLLLPGPPGLRPHVRLAFTHRHDAPIALFKSEPLKVIFGSADGITHRSGVETGGGVEVDFGAKGIVGLYAQATVLVLPHATLRPVTVLGEVGLAFALGPLRP